MNRIPRWTNWKTSTVPWTAFHDEQKYQAWTVSFPWTDYVYEQNFENKRIPTLKHFHKMKKIFTFHLWIHLLHDWIPTMNGFHSLNGKFQLNTKHERFSSLERKMKRITTWNRFFTKFMQKTWTVPWSECHDEQKIPSMNVFYPLNGFKMSAFPPWTFFGKKWTDFPNFV
jgi:hypothetical protein